MLSLPTVTLCVLESDFDAAVDLAQQMRKIIQFGAVRLSDHADYEGFLHEEFHIHERVTTQHLMTVHADGYVMHPELWNPKWLEYDFIGAPWPENYLIGSDPTWTYRVGNSGFCVRSLRLSRFAAALRTAHPAYDLTICQQFRRGLERAGFTYAPVEEAAKFSIEHLCHDSPEKAFGFHIPKHTHEEKGEKVVLVPANEDPV